MKNAILIAIASGLATAGVLAAFPALAQEANVSLVRTADLDLTNGEDRATLDQRLARAAREVCGEASDADVAGANDVRRCVDETLARAKAQRDQLLASAGRGAVIAVAAAR